MDVDPSCLKSMTSHLSVQGKISEPRMFGKATIMEQHQVLKVVANVTVRARGATKSAVPVGNRVGKAQEM